MPVIDSLPSAPLAGSYDHRLVALSLIIAIFAAYAALDLAGRIRANRAAIRIAWLLGGAFAMGTGIWAMHFIGMLAFRLPVPVLYDLPTVLLSLIAAVFASAVALYVVSRDRMTPTGAIAGSIFMGTGISTMHYTGMAAMRMQAMHHYHHGLWILSVILAIAISYVGLLMIYHSREEDLTWRRKIFTAILLGLAIPVMHYTGMAATTFDSAAMEISTRHSVNISSLANTAILLVTFLVLAFAILTSLVDRRLSAQQFILENERKMLRALIDNIPDCMYVKDTESRFVIANPQVAFGVGLTNPQDLIGKTDFDFFPFQLASVFREDERRIMRTGHPLFNHEEEVFDPLGNVVSTLTTKVPLRDSKGQITGIAGVGRNISERKKSEEALREAEQKYRAMFDEALVGIFKAGPTGLLLNANPTMAELMGYDSAADILETLTSPLWNMAVSDERRKEFMAAIAEFGHVRAFELEMFRKDHSRFWISSTVRAIIDNGVLSGFDGMFEDITERRLLRVQLAQAQKLESVGQLAAGIAHEINTPTQYIGDNVRFLKSTFQGLASLLNLYEKAFAEARVHTLSPETIAEMFEAIRLADLDYLLEEIPRAIDQTLEGVTRVSTLVSAMKEFSHPGTREKIPLDLNHAIQSTITVARNEWKYVAELETDFDPDLPLVACLPGEFNQVILNLIVNAAHAIADVVGPDGARGTIHIQTRQCSCGVEIRVRDSGGGIPAHVRPRIFDPFFTTKEIGKGTGQGLAIARSVIVDKHHGTIDFETTEGVGTTFILRLPYDGATLNPGTVAS